MIGLVQPHLEVVYDTRTVWVHLWRKNPTSWKITSAPVVSNSPSKSSENKYWRVCSTVIGVQANFSTVAVVFDLHVYWFMHCEYKGSSQSVNEHFSLMELVTSSSGYTSFFSLFITVSWQGARCQLQLAFVSSVMNTTQRSSVYLTLFPCRPCSS